MRQPDQPARRVTCLLLILAFLAAVAVSSWFADPGRSSRGKPAVSPVHSHRYLVAVRVARGVRSTPLRGLGWLIERVGFREGVSPFFMVGASGTESSVFRAPCSGNPRNGWGLGSCGAAWRAPYFRTWEQAFTYYARHVRRLWPRARTPFELYGYCACGSAYWGSKTVAWMRLLFGAGVPTGVRYPT